jgi:hypothetical protein
MEGPEENARPSTRRRVVRIARPSRAPDSGRYAFRHSGRYAFGASRTRASRTRASSFELRAYQGFEDQGFEDQGFEDQGFEDQGFELRASSPRGISLLPDIVARADVLRVDSPKQ